MDYFTYQLGNNKSVTNNAPMVRIMSIVNSDLYFFRTLANYNTYITLYFLLVVILCKLIVKLVLYVAIS